MGTNGRNGYSRIVDLRPMGPLRSPFTATSLGENGISVMMNVDQRDPFYLGKEAGVFRNGASLYVVDNGISRRIEEARKRGVVILTSDPERAKELGAEYVPADKIVEYVAQREEKNRANSKGSGHR